MHQENQRDSSNRQNSGLKLCVKDKWTKWTWSREIKRAVRKKDIKVPGDPR